MSAHTPGPWEYDEESMHVIAPKVGYQWIRPPVVASIGSLDYSEAGANARLIAAAPDLLQTLRDVLPHLTSGLMAAQVIHAIAKAAGEPTP